MRADRKKVEPLLRTARGQLDGVLKMIEDDRYCMEIVTQLQAVSLTVEADTDRKNIVLPVESADFCRLCLRNRASLCHLPQL